MTVCLALKLPWPDEVNFGPDCYGPKMVVIATDSRISNLYSGEATDHGEKLFQFAANALLAYAGNESLAKRTIESVISSPRTQLGTELRPDIWLTGDSAVEVVHDAMRAQYRLALGRGLQAQDLQTYVLVAFADSESKAARLVRLSTSADGEVHRTEVRRGGLYGIGTEAAYQFATEDALKELRRNRRYSDQPLDWVSFPVMGLQHMIESRRFDDSCGGLVQVAGISLEHGYLGHINHGVLYSEPGNGDSENPWVLTERQGHAWIRRVGDKVVSQTEGDLPFGTDDQGE